MTRLDSSLNRGGSRRTSMWIPWTMLIGVFVGVCLGAMLLKTWDAARFVGGRGDAPQGRECWVSMSDPLVWAEKWRPANLFDRDLVYGAAPEKYGLEMRVIHDSIRCYSLDKDGLPGKSESFGAWWVRPLNAEQGR